jgi:hypothetical protein
MLMGPAAVILLVVKDGCQEDKQAVCQLQNMAGCLQEEAQHRQRPWQAAGSAHWFESWLAVQLQAVVLLLLM